jgi:transposase
MGQRIDDEIERDNLERQPRKRWTMQEINDAIAEEYGFPDK